MAALALFVGAVFLAAAGFLLADQLDRFLAGGCILSPRKKLKTAGNRASRLPAVFKKDGG